VCVARSAPLRDFALVHRSVPFTDATQIISTMTDTAPTRQIAAVGEFERARKVLVCSIHPQQHSFRKIAQVLRFTLMQVCFAIQSSCRIVNARFQTQ
jgi:hypothetical protein